jgi:AcrR family transcriptional regulator
MNTQSEHDAKRRILIAAKKLFARQGFDGTTVRQICEEAGANVALVSYYFGGKEKVLEEVLKTFLPVGRLNELEEAMNAPVEGVIELVRSVIRLGYTDPEIKAILNIEIAFRTPRLAMLQEVALPFWSGLRGLLQKGKELEEFHFEDLDQTLMMVVGTLFIHTKAHYFEPIFEHYPFEFERLARETCRFVLAGIGYRGEHLNQFQ